MTRTNVAGGTGKISVQKKVHGTLVIDVETGCGARPPVVNDKNEVVSLGGTGVYESAAMVCLCVITTPKGEGEKMVKFACPYPGAKVEFDEDLCNRTLRLPRWYPHLLTPMQAGCSNV